MKRHSIALATAAALGLFIVGMPASATTTTELTLSDGAGNSVTIDQSGAVTGTGTFTTISSAGSGPHDLISWNGSVGGFTVNVTTGRGGGAEVYPALMNLNSIDVNSGGAGSLTLGFTDTDYTDFTTGFNLSASTTIVAGTALGGSATFRALGSASNSIPATTLIGSLGPVTYSNPPGPSTALSASLNQDFANPIGTSGSLTEQIALAFTGKGEIDTGFTVSAVPEPASGLLLGSLLWGAGLLFRRKMKARNQLAA
ncbi:MAG: PEP-CTERM sorting domain-containing protein [Bryobacteraceae bacterium]